MNLILNTSDNPLIGKRLIDKRGIGCVIDRLICKHPNNSRKDQYLVKFDNKTERVYSRIHLIHHIKDDILEVESSVSAYEFIGKEFLDKTGDHKCMILAVTKQRYNFAHSYIKVKWDTGVETEHLLGKIIHSRIPYHRACAHKDKDKYRLITLTNFEWKFGGYCKIPESLTYFVIELDGLVKWKSMMTRCYQKKFQEKAYEKIEVCKEWFNFYNFGLWYRENRVKDWVLDKDLKGLNHYGPDSCMFIPAKLNAVLVIKPGADHYPSGIYKTNLPGRKPYVAAFNVHGKTINCDYHNSIIDGFIRVKILKEYYISELAEKMFSDTTDPNEFKILNLCRSFQVHDKRYEHKDRITETQIIEYLQKETNRYDIDNYYELRSYYIHKYEDFFQPRKEKINQTIKEEFNC